MAAPRDGSSEQRRLDPRDAFEGDALAAHLLEGDARSGAVAHIQARDPRARLQAAAAALHGGRTELPGDARDDEHAQNGGPVRRLRG